MKSEAQRSIKRVFKLGFITIVLLFMANADALLLGDIQVNSTLGQPLKARIAIVDLSGVDVQQLKMRLASVEDYQSLGLQYPDPHKFNFLLVNEQGALLPVIRITTPYPVVDPFVNLLMEISSPAGRLIKAYTFLLDPSSGSSAALDAIEPHPLSPSSATEMDRGAARPVKSAVRHHKHQVARLRVAQIEHGLLHGSSQMKLALSLSISSYDPSAPVSASRDALQEELIAKEKSLEDLKLQIGEMQMVIKSLEDKRGLSASSSVASVSSMPVGRVVQPVRETLPVVQVSPRWMMNWLNAGLALAILLLGGTGFVLYRKYKQSQALQQGPFDDLHEEKMMEVAIKEPRFINQEEILVPDTSFVVPQAASSPEASPEALQVPQVSQVPMEFESLPFGERATLTYTEHEPIVPPEYAILMEAKRHLRAGNDTLAEEALIRAIGVNPRNLYGYQALLGIYETRKDTGQFERIARQLKEYGDLPAFEEVAERGRMLDPENPLYLFDKQTTGRGI